MSRTLALDIKNLIFPIFCRGCGRRLLTEENGFFCPTCWERSPRVERPFCTMCGRPHPGMVGYGSRNNFPCAKCREAGKRAFRRVYGAARYEDAVADAIKLLKFSGKRRLAGPLAEMMAEYAENEIDCADYDFLIPVPLHKVRQRARGFNQSQLIAQALLPVFRNAQLDESLRRIRPTKVQSRLKDAAERRANIVGAFAVEGDGLAGKTVLLIDDVVTTGGTVEECAKALLRASVVAVDVFAAALA